MEICQDRKSLPGNIYTPAMVVLQEAHIPLGLLPLRHFVSFLNAFVMRPCTNYKAKLSTLHFQLSQILSGPKPNLDPSYLFCQTMFTLRLQLLVSTLARPTALFPRWKVSLLQSVLASTNTGSQTIQQLKFKLGHFLAATIPFVFFRDRPACLTIPLVCPKPLVSTCGQGTVDEWFKWSMNSKQAVYEWQANGI